MQTELFRELADVPPCSLCGARAYRPGCPRCAARKHVFTPPTEAELVDRATARAALEVELRAAAEAEQRRLDDLRARPFPLDVALIGCGKSKRTSASPAAHLYTGSLFRAALAYAHPRFDQLYVISARYGLVRLEQTLEPYELSLQDLGRSERLAWGRQVASALLSRYPFEHVRITFFAGAEYARWIELALPRMWTTRSPLAGLGLGARLQRLYALSDAGVQL